MKNNYLILFFFGFVITTFLGCTNKMEKYNLTVYLNGAIVESPDDPLPEDLKSLLNPSECNEIKLDFVPEIKVHRLDISKENEMELEVPLSMENKLRKKMGTYTYVDLKRDYAENLPTMKAGEFLSKKGDVKPVNQINHKSNTVVFNLSNQSNIKNGEYNSLNVIKTKIDSIMCVNENSSTKNFAIVFKTSEGSQKPPIGHNETEEPDQGIDEPLPTDPCNITTVIDGQDLKEDLLKIIDARRSYQDRDKIAKETWEKYFDKMASIKMYYNPDDKYYEFWESGEGSNYLIDRLAYKNSITEINIIRIEYHRETKKITAITTVECHNASQIQ